MNLGENIYHYRTQKNMSQGDLAQALDVSRQSVSKWENNNAVPELDKLMKLAEIFEISLDELVGKLPPTLTADPTPAPCETVQAEKQTSIGIANEKLLAVGAILVVSTVALSQVLASEFRFDAIEILLLTIPLVLCGILCITTKHAGFYSSWVGAAGYWVYFFLLSRRWEEQHLLILLGITLVITMVFWSIRIHRRGTLRIPLWVWIVGTLLLSAAGILLLMNTVPPFWIGNSYTPVSP